MMSPHVALLLSPETRRGSHVALGTQAPEFAPAASALPLTARQEA